MASPIPKAPGQRQRRNRTANSAVLDAGPAMRVALPKRWSAIRCVAIVDSKKGCPLAGAAHDLENFARAEVEPHDFAPAEAAWHPMTLSWWETIWNSPMANEWVDADVPPLVALAALIEQFWIAPDARVAAEIRMQQREFGLSPLSRRQLQWEIKRAEGELPAVPPGRRRSPKSTLAVLAGGKR